MTRIHRGLRWINGPEAQLDLLVRDPVLGPLLVCRPHPTLLGFLPSAQEKVLARLARIGNVPRRVEA